MLAFLLCGVARVLSKKMSTFEKYRTLEVRFCWIVQRFLNYSVKSKEEKNINRWCFGDIVFR